MKTLRTIEHSPASLPYNGMSVTAAFRKDERDHLIYAVSGRGTFPEDMLRYDNAFILSPVLDNSEASVLGSRQPRTFNIRGLGCTPERWRSFGWTVHDPIIENRYR